MSGDRREFIRQILAAGVFTVACPHITLGRIVPEIDDSKETITGIYKVKISDYPELSKLWGSVRMTVEGIPPEFHYPKMIVSKIDPEYWGANYSAVSEACPHEGYPIELLSEDFVPDPLFECKKGHGSLYLPDGTYFWGVSKKDLVKYELTWDEADLLSIEVPALTTSEIESKYPELSYMSECFPNPASDKVSILFGTEAISELDISIFDTKGNHVRTLQNGRIDAGHHQFLGYISDIPQGNYFIKMSVNHRIVVVRKLIVVH